MQLTRKSTAELFWLKGYHRRPLKGKNNSHICRFSNQHPSTKPCFQFTVLSWHDQHNSSLWNMSVMIIQSPCLECWKKVTSPVNRGMILNCRCCRHSKDFVNVGTVDAQVLVIQHRRPSACCCRCAWP